MALNDPSPAPEGGLAARLDGVPTREACNAPRYRGDAAGHYESYFQRANHPSRPLAFWIRYTIFAPRGRPQDAVGELWAVCFDGERGRHTAVKEVYPLVECDFSPTRLEARVGEALLDDHGLTGCAASHGREIAWSLRYESPEPPLLLLPERLYGGRIPKAKALVGSPQAVYQGELNVNGRRVPVDNWVGSQNHNWGSRHTNHYAWGQVAGFENRPDAFLECATARISLGPVPSPWLTLMVLRMDGETLRFNTLVQAVRARGRYEFFDWQIRSRRGGTTLDAHIHADREAFVGLTYDDPPGGQRTCLNTKIARCTLRVHRKGNLPLELHTENRAAFEILTNRTDHGVPLLDSPSIAR